MLSRDTPLSQRNCGLALRNVASNVLGMEKLPRRSQKCRTCRSFEALCGASKAASEVKLHSNNPNRPPYLGGLLVEEGAGETWGT